MHCPIWQTRKNTVNVMDGQANVVTVLKTKKSGVAHIVCNMI